MSGKSQVIGFLAVPDDDRVFMTEQLIGVQNGLFMPLFAILSGLHDLLRAMGREFLSCHINDLLDGTA